MEQIKESHTSTNLLDFSQEMGREFAQRATEHDNNDQFVERNYEDLKSIGLFAATIPKELGGKGVTHSDMCKIIKTIATYCSSTALALSMHQHLIAAMLWKYKNGQGGEATLQKIAEKQLVLVSTGAKDWLESNGEVRKTEGGYIVDAQKHFASQSTVGDLIVTSAPYEDEEKGWVVLHFAIPLRAENVEIIDNWKAMGMRGTGSCTVRLNRVFVPESAITLIRPRGQYHPFWNVVLAVALPLIMSAYVGIAEKAANIAIESAKKKEKPSLKLLIGELYNHSTTAKVIWEDMIALADNLDFAPNNRLGHEMLTRKTLVAKACIQTVDKAMEAMGGQSYFRSMEVERLYRDVKAGTFHPLPEKEQQLLSGNFLISGEMIS